MINGNVQSHHRRHHGDSKSGSGKDDEDGFILSWSEEPGNQALHNGGSDITLGDESADDLGSHMGQGIAKGGKGDVSLQAGVIESHNVYKDKYHNDRKNDILKFCLWHCFPS